MESSLLKKYLDNNSFEYLNIKTKFIFLKSYYDKVSDIAGDSKCYSANITISDIIIPSVFDSLIIDFADWGKSVEKNFFNKIKSDCMPSFKKYKFSKKDIPKGSSYYVNFTPTSEQIRSMEKQERTVYLKEMKEQQRKVVESIIPDYYAKKNGKVSHQDIDYIATKLYEAVEEIITFRNKHTAHKLSSNDSLSFKLSLESIGKSMDEVESILNAIRAMLFSSVMSYELMGVEIDETAKCFTDLTMYRSIDKKNWMMGIDCTISGRNKSKALVAKRSQSLEVHLKKYLQTQDRSNYFFKQLYPISKK